MNQIEELSLLMRHLSHDLRNTLGSNNKLLQLLKVSYGDQLDDRANRWLDLIEKESTSGLNKLKRLSEFVKLYTTEYSFKEIELAGLITSSCVESATEMNASLDQFEYDAQNKILLSGEPHLIKSAVKSLLQNSLEHSRTEPSEVKVKLSIESTDLFYNLKIEDNGNKLRSGTLETLKEPFRGSQSHSNNTGLGLNIVQQIMAIHKGKMALNESEGPSLVVTLSFPKS